MSTRKRRRRASLEALDYLEVPEEDASLRGARYVQDRARGACET